MSKLEMAIRLADVAEGDLPRDLDDSRISYWKSPSQWWIYLPRAGVGRLIKHSVEEHDDGTITVKPSIGLRHSDCHGYARHGFLTRGEWREC